MFLSSWKYLSLFFCSFVVVVLFNWVGGGGGGGGGSFCFITNIAVPANSPCMFKIILFSFCYHLKICLYSKTSLDRGERRLWERSIDKNVLVWMLWQRQCLNKGFVDCCVAGELNEISQWPQDTGGSFPQKCQTSPCHSLYSSQQLTVLFFFFFFLFFSFCFLVVLCVCACKRLDLVR